MRSLAPSPYFPAIDGLRAVAVLSVIVFHVNSAWLPGGFLGVDIFFAISGYVVTAALYHRREMSLSRFLQVFYLLRVRRILPALIFCVCTTYLLAVLFIPPLREVREAAVYSLLGFSNFFFATEEMNYFGLGAEANPFSHMWSLSIEEQFYIVYPLFCFTILRLRASNLVKNLPILGLVAASMGYFGYMTYIGDRGYYYNSFARFWEIMVGAQLFFVLRVVQERHQVTRLAVNALFAIGAGGIALSLAFASNATPHFFFIVSLSTCAAIAAAVMGATVPSGWPSLLSRGPLVHIGVLSYALYLWHWPILTLFRWTISLEIVWFQAIALLLTYLLALCSGRVVERPMKALIVRRPVPSLAGIAAIYVAGLSAIQVGAPLVSGGDPYTPLAFRNVPTPHDWDSTWRGCHFRYHHDVEEAAIKRCLSRPDNAPRNLQAIFVVGDSHANAISYAVKEAFRGEAAIDFNQMHNNGIPVILEKGEIPVEIRHVLEEVGPGDVLIITFFRAAMYQSVQDTFYVGLKDDPMLEPGVQAKFDNGLEALGAIARKLSEAGANLVLIRDVPQLAKPLRVQACMVQRSLGLPNPCDVDGNLSLHRRLPMDRLIDRVAADNPNVHVWDPHPLVCPGARCTFYEGGRFLMIDNNHLAQAESERLGPALARFFDEEGIGKRMEGSSLIEPRADPD